MDKVRDYFIEFLYEDGKPDFAEFSALISLIMFFAVSIYLMAYGITWTHYDTFATLTGGGGIASQVAKRFINKKYDGGAINDKSNTERHSNNG